MIKPYYITATGTPLTEDEQLHVEGLELHLEDQWRHGIDGILVAGSMGAMQLLTDETYRSLITRSVELWAGHGEILIGAGDASFSRTKERIEFVNQFKVDGVAVLAPYFWNFGQEEQVEYFSALADISKAPIYLYDLPLITGTKLSMETMLALAKHPNIAGAKLSCDVTFTIPLIEAIGDSFRVIVAKPDLVDVLMRSEICTHLDGMWAIVPKWTVQIGKCAEKGDWAGAAENRRNIIKARNLLGKYGGGVFTVLMNARGIPGRFMPRPMAILDGAKKEKILAEDITQKLIQDNPVLTN